MKIGQLIHNSSDTQTRYDTTSPSLITLQRVLRTNTNATLLKSAPPSTSGTLCMHTNYIECCHRIWWDCSWRHNSHGAFKFKIS